MCTVSYIPPLGGNSFVLTSNRDEKAFRPTLAPKTYVVGDKRLTYPKDEKAGGSWIALNHNGKICCLLNGGFRSHSKEAHHTLSRGAILLDLAASDLSVQAFFKSKELANVEPFTIVTIEQDKSVVHKLSEFVWDGSDSHFRALDRNTPHIWSSATLYNTVQRTKRKEWFESFYSEACGSITPEKIHGFHSGAHTADASINVVMRREGGLRTVSITQVFARENTLLMHYADLLKNTNSLLEI